MSQQMQAIIISKFGGPDVLISETVPKPVPSRGEVLIKVKAFGLNHAEMHMRKGEWDEWNPITGLECVGVVEECPGGDIPVGTKVAGIMGGMGRSRPGSYGEYVTTPITNVVALETNLPWEELAAIPEVYTTAWSCLFTVLDLKAGERILIRGATSTIGQAAVHLAVDLGAKVTATTRRQDRFEWLKSLGVVDAVREQQNLQTQFVEEARFDKVLSLIGNSVLVESIRLATTGGRVLQAGWLGGLAPVKDFNPMVEMESGVHFSLFHSKVVGTPDFPLSAVPLQEIVGKIENGAWSAKPVAVFDVGDIQAAHALLDSHDSKGKIIIKRV
ncbi:GroES-like protein [Polyplosphaeria fusca]|uniref:GroES-like protein n=1 Tax=Polyplosphaeria fusca TaxID=682080 RepID=A0A9P4QSW2_9PLEO|nr:GroES-like protein [Polyplosphaeria fusca]